MEMETDYLQANENELLGYVWDEKVVHRIKDQQWGNGLIGNLPENKKIRFGHLPRHQLS